MPMTIRERIGDVGCASVIVIVFLSILGLGVWLSKVLQ